ncbi:MAG: PTS transporter subunit EIIC [Erysipelotrichaceae bacterium]|nr:PTS transporter subunit EIIC [Erysipelotrichaceae bacterium]
MGKYQEMCEKALEAMGGLENISFVTNCATRLRINYINKSKVDEEALKNLPNSAGLVPKHANKQMQIIIGPNVRDAYYEFLDVSGWKDNGSGAPAGANDPVDDEEEVKKDLLWLVNKFGSFMTPIMMPVVPAMIVGGMILAFRNLLMNYFGMTFEGGAYWLVMAIFNAGFNFLPIYVGWQTAEQLRIKPILGGMLGGLLLSSYLPQVTDIFGIAVPAGSYGSTVLPVLLGVVVMAPIYKFWNKVVPEALSFFVVPILTMIVIAPIELVLIAPLGSAASGAIATFATFITDKANIIAQPILAALYPYMVMIGLDKGLSPIGLELMTTLGYNAVTAPMGFISNIAVGGSALAVATTIKNDVAKKGMFSSFGVTALCGVTEPAFYGVLLTNPVSLLGTATGAVAGGLLAGAIGLRTFVQGGCPGWLTLVFFVDTSGDATYMFWAVAVAVLTTVTSFIATRVILATIGKKK